uniref:Uncharacterized protein MANES_13G047900 n=2 Tax=Rhizophora mucronata TaxID=61149 RepID=A0A2P2KZU8_RHIMU
MAEIKGSEISETAQTDGVPAAAAAAEEEKEQAVEKSDFDPKTMRKTKPGLKRLFLTISLLFSFLLGFPLLWKSVEIYRSSLPFDEIDSLSKQLESKPLLFPFHFQVVFLDFHPVSSSSSSANLNPGVLQRSILAKISDLTSKKPQCGTLDRNFTLSVTVDAHTSGCTQSSGDDLRSCIYECGVIRAVDYDFDDDEAVDDALESALGGQCLDSGRKVYSVVVVKGFDAVEAVRAVVGKYRHAWFVVGKGSLVTEALLDRVAEVFVKVFVNGGREEGLLHGEFMPVGADGRIVLSFNLLNANPQDWIYDWNFQSVDETLLAPMIEALRPIASISVESQVLYHTPKSSFSFWDEKLGSYIFSIKDLPFFVNSNEWHLDTSTAAGGRSKILHFVVYIPSAKECPLLLQLPDGEISMTNGFISPMWGGVMVWNPKACLMDSNNKLPERHVMSPQVRHLVIYLKNKVRVLGVSHVLKLNLCF